MVNNTTIDRLYLQHQSEMHDHFKICCMYLYLFHQCWPVFRAISFLFLFVKYWDKFSLIDHFILYHIDYKRMQTLSIHCKHAKVICFDKYYYNLAIFCCIIMTNSLKRPFQTIIWVGTSIALLHVIWGSIGFFVWFYSSQCCCRCTDGKGNSIDSRF